MARDLARLQKGLCGSDGEAGLEGDPVARGRPVADDAVRPFAAAGCRARTPARGPAGWRSRICSGPLLSARTPTFSPRPSKRNVPAAPKELLGVPQPVPACNRPDTCPVPPPGPARAPGTFSGPTRRLTKRTGAHRALRSPGSGRERRHRRYPVRGADRARTCAECDEALRQGESWEGKEVGVWVRGRRKGEGETDWANCELWVGGGRATGVAQGEELRPGQRRRPGCVEHLGQGKLP